MKSARPLHSAAWRAIGTQPGRTILGIESTKKVPENADETALLKHFGFDAMNPADIARVKQLLQTEGNPFAKVRTMSETGKFVAFYNNCTGKYEVVDNVEKNLYRQLQGKAA